MRVNENNNIPFKANWLLNLLLFALLLIFFRCWHLSVIQYDRRLEEAQRPQKRTILEPAKRATIRDRFNIPLAVNKVQYQATILYSQIKEIPAVIWKKDPSTGKKIRFLKRREYIKDLAEVLSKELNLDSKRLLDLIHSKATLYGHIPYLIKSDLSEKEYYRLKMLEKDWAGIHVRRYPKRYYPEGKVASNIIGYMGAIKKEDYEKVMQEIKALEATLINFEEGKISDFDEGSGNYQEIKKRLHDLKEKAYTINDYVGKNGIEGKFEEEMRGFQGKKSYHSDARGNFLLELPGSRDPIPGQRILLTISSELQQFAEELLIKNESFRKSRLSELATNEKAREPWIKGGAIVAMDPKNGELLALASYPRFDPNDFVPCGNNEEKEKKNSNVACWFETEHYLAEIWDQKAPLVKESFDPKFGITNKEVYLEWEKFLHTILPDNNPIITQFQKFPTIKDAIDLQRIVAELISLTQSECLYHLFNNLYQEEGHIKYGSNPGAVVRDRLITKIENNENKINQFKRKLSKYYATMSSNYDKVLYLDLCRLMVNADLFSNNLLNTVGNQSLSLYKNASGAFSQLDKILKNITKELFHNIDFEKWRESEEKEFLKEIRFNEKKEKKYPKPYLDYLDKKEAEMFDIFWGRYRLQFLSVFLTGKWMDYHRDEEIDSYLKYFLIWHKELQQGAHICLPWVKAYHFLSHQLKDFDVELTIEYLQTFRSYEDLDRPLFGKYKHIKKINGKQFEKNLATAFYPSYGYGYARSHAFRQATTQGSLFKLVTAYEALVQKYESQNDPNININKLNPLTIEDHFYKLGKDEFVGKFDNEQPIPRFYKGGRIPKSLSNNIGKVDIIAAIEKSSNPYFALLAGDFLSKNSDLAEAAKKFSFGEKTGIDLPLEISGKVPQDLEENKTGLYAMSIGQHSLVVTPLQTAVMLSTIANGGKVLKPKIVRLSVGQLPNRNEEIVLCKPPYKFQNYYTSVGIDFPLFTAAHSKNYQSAIYPFLTEVKRELFFPDQFRKILMEGMKRVVERSQQFGIASLQNLYRQDPEAIRDFLSLKGQLIGKTSTAESLENVDLDLNQGTNKYNHLWFGGISFEQDKDENTFIFKDKFGNPELVVVVYLRYGTYGKDTMPIAAQVIKKWREIKSKYKDKL